MLVEPIKLSVMVEPVKLPMMNYGKELQGLAIADKEMHMHIMLTITP